MQAIQYAQAGDVSVVKLCEVEKPKIIKPGMALIKLKNAGINFIDIYQRNGRYPVPFPYIPGMEGAGIVEAIGEGVTVVKPGDRVAYTMTPGSYAEYNVVPAERLIPLPDDISFEQGAAFPLQGMTTHYLLHDFYPVKTGSKVLVHAAAGGVGLLLVQWAKHLGAEVFGTVSTTEKEKLARAAGADHVINYATQDFAVEIKKLTNNIGVDYIIDGVGKSTFQNNFNAVRTRGHICIFGSASGAADPIAPNSLQANSITVSGGSLHNHIQTRDELLRRSHDVLEGMSKGWLKLTVDHVYPLAQAANAQDALEMRQTTGKVVLEI